MTAEHFQAFDDARTAKRRKRMNDLTTLAAQRSTLKDEEAAELLDLAKAVLPVSTGATLYSALADEIAVAKSGNVLYVGWRTSCEELAAKLPPEQRARVCFIEQVPERRARLLHERPTLRPIPGDSDDFRNVRDTVASILAAQPDRQLATLHAVGRAPPRSTVATWDLDKIVQRVTGPNGLRMLAYSAVTQFDALCSQYLFMPAPGQTPAELAALKAEIRSELQKLDDAANGRTSAA